MDRNSQNSPASQPQSNSNQVIGCDEIRKLVQRKARGLVARVGLLKTEQEDVEQTLYASLLKAWQSYDPDQGGTIPFAERVLQNACKVLQRDRFAPKRDHRRNVSLSIAVRIDDGAAIAELAQLIEQSEVHAHLGIVHRDEYEEFELHEDVAAFIADLPYELRELARALKYETVYQISRRTRVPRTRLYRRLVRLREAAQNVGLEEYLR